MKKPYLSQLSFIAEVQSFDQLPSTLKDGFRQEIALVGRSNVGKSSLLNALAREKIAKISSTPGKTRGLIFFEGENLTFVDLPGYGYAKVSTEERGRFSYLTEEYLTKRNNLKCILFLLDIRHLPSELDREMKRWLDHKGLPYAILLTKKDKLTESLVKKQVSAIAQSLGIEESELIPYTYLDQRSSKQVLTKIKSWI